MKNVAKMALSGKSIYNGFSEKALTTNFELFNLAPSDHPYPSKASVHQESHRQKRSTRNTKGTNNEYGPTKWRRVGLVSASSVRLDTIVWPGGDIVVSGNYSDNERNGKNKKNETELILTKKINMNFNKYRPFGTSTIRFSHCNSFGTTICYGIRIG